MIVSTIPDSVLKGTTNAQLIKIAEKLAPHARTIVTAETFTGVRDLYAQGASFVFSPRIMNARELARTVVAAVERDLEPERQSEMLALSTRVEVLP